MNLSKCSPEQLALDLLDRSTCRVQVAAVFSDAHGIFAWGWNHMGEDGLGEHAEMNALKRANRKRVYNSTLTVAAQRNSKIIMACPCGECWKRLAKFALSVNFTRQNPSTWEWVKM